MGLSPQFCFKGSPNLRGLSRLINGRLDPLRLLKLQKKSIRLLKPHEKYNWVTVFSCFFKVFSMLYQKSFIKVFTCYSKVPHKSIIWDVKNQLSKYQSTRFQCFPVVSKDLYKSESIYCVSLIPNIPGLPAVLARSNTHSRATSLHTSIILYIVCAILYYRWHRSNMWLDTGECTDS